MKLGILGTGQLAMMLAEAAIEEGLQVATWGVKTCEPLEHICETHYGQDFADSKALQAFIDSVDVLTFDTENTPIDALAKVNLGGKLLPSTQALTIFQDRNEEKAYLNSQGIATAVYYYISENKHLATAAETVGFPAILKTSQDGYDGKGQAVVKNLAELTQAWENLKHAPCVLEQMVNFIEEISIVCARDQKGHMAFFPVSVNTHQHGQLILSLVNGQHPLQALAQSIAKTVVEDLNYVGCLAVEFFVVGDTLLVNEVAPRVHNSGHWTLNASDASQFAMHVKAVCGKDINQPKVQTPAAMVNCISNMPEANEFTEHSFYNVYDYGKTARPMRKLGHINVSANGQSEQAFYQHVAKALIAINEPALAKNLPSL